MECWDLSENFPYVTVDAVELKDASFFFFLLFFFFQITVEYENTNIDKHIYFLSFQ